MRIINDVIQEASIQPAKTIGNIIALDASDTTSYPGTGTTWYDLSGNGNNGTFVNSPTFANSAITLNGSNQYIEIADSASQRLMSGYNWSYEMWLWVSPGSEFYKIPLCRGTAEYAGDGVYIRPYELYLQDPGNDNISYNGRNYDTNYGVGVSGAGYSLSLSRWHQVAITSNSTVLTVYLDGVAFKQGYSDGNISPVDLEPTNPIYNVPTYIGARYASNYWFKGKVGVVNIWNRTVTPQEVQANYLYYSQTYN